MQPKTLAPRAPSILTGRHKTVLSNLLLASSLFFSQIAAAGVIPIGSELSLKAIANSNGAGEVIDSDNMTQGSSLNDLNVSVEASSATSNSYLTVSGSASASWVNPAQGSVSFDNIGFDSLNNTSVSFMDLGGWHGEPSWSYTFVADVTGQFTLDWSVHVEEESTTNYGIGGFRFTLLGAGGGQSIYNVGDVGSTRSGIDSRNIIAGLQYTALLQTSPGLVGGIGTQTSYMDGVFNWSMDSGPFESVPEPAPLALLLLGIVGMGIKKRSQQGTLST